MSETPKSSEDPASLEGTTPPVSDAASRARALEQAFDYRGDVTIETTDGRCLEGYVYDRNAEPPVPLVRVMLKTGGNAEVRFDEVQRLTFSGKDTAAGKSWETWVQQYVEKKLNQTSAP